MSGQLHVPADLAPGKNSGTHWTRGWVSTRAGLNALEKRKITCPCWGSNPGRQTHSPSLYLLSYPGNCRVLFGKLKTIVGLYIGKSLIVVHSVTVPVNYLTTRKAYENNRVSYTEFVFCSA
jgi:hypothetical protein